MDYFHNTTEYHNPLPDEAHWKIDLTELKAAASRLRNKRAPGIDGIPNEVVKVIVARNPNVLLSVFNSCLAEEIFPHKWKIARLVLLRKGDNTLANLSPTDPYVYWTAWENFSKKSWTHDCEIT